MATLLPQSSFRSPEASRLRVRVIVIGLVLLLSTAVAMIPDPLVGLALLTVLGLLVGAAVLLRWPALGLLALIPMNMIIPIGLGTGTGSELNGSMLLIGALTGLWLFDMVRRGEFRIHRAAPVLPLVLFIVFSILAFLNGQLPWFPVEGAPLAAQVGGLGVFVISAATFLLGAHLITDVKWLKWITWLFVALSALYILARVTPQLYRPVGRLFLWGSTASQFWIWLTAIVFSQALLNRELRAPLRLALWALFAGICYAALGQTFDWISGWIPPAVAVGTIVGLRWPRMLLVLLLVAVIAIPSGIAYLIGIDEYSFSTRLDAWMVLLDIIRVNPFLGSGPSNYYWYTSLFGIRGYFVEFNSHNQYLDLIAQIGLLGLIPFLWFSGSVAQFAWRLRARVPEGFEHAYVYGALGGLAGTLASGMLGDWILPFVYNVGLVGLRSSLLGWLFLGALVALDQEALPARSASIPEESPASLLRAPF